MFTSPIPFQSQRNRDSVLVQRKARRLSMPAGGCTSAYRTQVNIALQPEDLAGVRFAMSPLWECIAAFRAWMNPHPPAVLLPWRAQLSKGFAALDWSPLTHLALVARGTIPDFLCPPPITALPTLGMELEALRGTPDDLLRDEVRIAYGNAVPACLESAMLQPRKFLDRLAQVIEEFWEKAIAPHWVFLRARLEGEMLYRARTLALGGASELFASLHKDVSLQDGRLTEIGRAHV